MRKSSLARYVAQVVPEPILYVVANRSDAIFYAEGGSRTFQFIDRLSNRSGHLTETELVSDKPGTGMSNASGSMIHHGLDRRFKHHEQVARKFARKIARLLGIARREGKFSELVLVAEPHFLGLLRSELDPETRRTIKCEICHEYAQGSDAAIRSLILNAMEAAR